jgi:nucleolar GTP-binding protein
METQKIAPVKTADDYIDMAFSAARRAARDVDVKGMKSEINKAKKKEIAKVTAVRDSLRGEIARIGRQFPQHAELTPFYIEIFKCFVNLDEYKQSLGALNWLRKKVIQFCNVYGKKIKSCDNVEDTKTFSKAFFGRIASFVKQVKGDFLLIETMRSQLRELPTIKEDCLNVALFGFPNVGKSTLLAKLTSAKPPISDYEFTTKRINVGYTSYYSLQVQIMDTPGTLNRFEKMNLVEKQAHIVLETLADVCIFVVDPTRDQDAQWNLLQVAKKTGVTVRVFCSKADIADKEILDACAKRFEAVSNQEGIDAILKEASRIKELKMIADHQAAQASL